MSQLTRLFPTSLFGLLVSPRGAVPERRDEVQHLAFLFPEEPSRVLCRA